LELGAILGRELRTDEEIRQGAAVLQQRGARNVLVSMAAKGAILLDETGRYHKIFAPEGTVKNSVGAGDSMVAGFLAGWLEKRDYAHA
ncbi:PfkB family carbohydrate kinase, partial [Escherichia coli]|nr:PfkB family carbohydrate kinase [Escherichia coli]